MDDVRQDERLAVSSDVSDVSPQKVVAASLKRERSREGISLAELARRAGVGKSTLSQLESGEGNPSIETLWALSVALGIQFSALVDPPRPLIEVIRLGDGPTFGASEADSYTATLLSAARPGTRRDTYLIRADRGRPRVSEPHARGVVEHVVLCRGRAVVGPTESSVELAPGDYVNYPGDVEHTFDALEDDTVAVLLSES